MDVMVSCFSFVSSASLTQNVSRSIDFEHESFLTIQMDSDAEAGLLSTLVKDPGRRPVTLATPYPLVSASPGENAGNGENVRAGAMEGRSAD